MPTKVSERWIADGNAVKSDLEKIGYKADLSTRTTTSRPRFSRSKTMITKGAKVLIIAAIDGTSLTDLLDAAAKAGIKVISYDRLHQRRQERRLLHHLRQLQGRRPAGALAADRARPCRRERQEVGGKGPFNVELFAGSPDDNNANFFFNGAMDTLKPYLDDGTLVVKSGQTKFKQVAILRWDPATAQKRMEDLAHQSYSDGAKVEGVLSPYDGLSDRHPGALESAGYGSGGKRCPIVTGQDAERAR